MATKASDAFYKVSPGESLTFTISGPADPEVDLGGKPIQPQPTSGQAFTITAAMIPDIKAYPMNCVLPFPAGADAYSFKVDDQNGNNLDQFQATGPDDGSVSKVDITIEVVK